MSEVTQLPGGPGVAAPGALANGDGATITQVNQFGPVLTTDIQPSKNEALAGILAGTDMPAGTPVYCKNQSTPAIGPAYANLFATSGVMGLLVRSVVEGDDVVIRDRGCLTLTEAEWNAVVQGTTTGLEIGVFYYLNTNTVQKPIVANEPSGEGDASVLLGYCVGPQTMYININFLAVIVS